MKKLNKESWMRNLWLLWRSSKLLILILLFSRIYLVIDFVALIVLQSCFLSFDSDRTSAVLYYFRSYLLNIEKPIHVYLYRLLLRLLHASRLISDINQGIFIHLLYGLLLVLHAGRRHLLRSLASLWAADRILRLTSELTLHERKLHQSNSAVKTNPLLWKYTKKIQLSVNNIWHVSDQLHWIRPPFLVSFPWISSAVGG